MTPGCLLLFPDGSSSLKTIHIRHLHVHKHQIKSFLLQCGQSFPAIAGHGNLVPPFLEEAECELPVDGGILNQKNL